MTHHSNLTIYWIECVVKVGWFGLGRVRMEPRQADGSRVYFLTDKSAWDYLYKHPTGIKNMETWILRWGDAF